MNYKKCSICEDELPTTKEYFYENKSNKVDGLFPYCKRCSSLKSQNWQKDNPGEEWSNITFEMVEPVQDRFWKKVVTSETNFYNETPCWEWIGSTCSNGYGQIRINRKLVFVHRISYLLEYGNLENNILVLHKCDNRTCCNPDHLFLGTHSQNTLDSVNKGRWGLWRNKNKDE